MFRLIARRAPSLTVVAALLTAGCGGAVAPSVPANGVSQGPGATSPPAATTAPPAATGSTNSWPWESATAEEHPHVVMEPEAEPSASPDGNPVGGLGLEPPTDEPSATFSAEGMVGVAPCELVTAQEWGAWTEATLGSADGAVPMSLEDGGACGWIAPGDRLRMAIASFTAAGAERWLDADAAAAGVMIEGLGDSAIWVGAWPVPASSTLVVQSGRTDLVIEMSSLDANDQLLSDAARHFAAIALERLP